MAFTLMRDCLLAQHALRETEKSIVNMEHLISMYI